MLLYIRYLGTYLEAALKLVPFNMFLECLCYLPMNYITFGCLLYQLRSIPIGVSLEVREIEETR